MSITLDAPLDYPTALLKRRVHLPKCLYAVVEEPQISSECNDVSVDIFTKSKIEAHLSRKGECNIPNSLVSAYESEDLALQYGKRRKPIKLTLSTSGLIPAWLTTTAKFQVPVWVSEDGEGNYCTKYLHPSVWICLEEARVVLGIPDHLCEKGEWLTHSPCLSQRIIESELLEHLQIPKRNTDAEATNGVFTDKQSSQELHHLTEDKPNPSHPSSPFLQIPTRKSSLRSLKKKPSNNTIPSTSSSNTPPTSQLRLATRNATVTLTNADPQRASSLMKYALLMAYGKKREAEEMWDVDTSCGSSSMEVLDEDGGREVWRESLDVEVDVEVQSQTSSRHDNPRSGKRDQTSVRDRHHLGNPAHGSQTDAPSPVTEPSTEACSFSPRTRRSRIDILHDLESDEDPLLREYARLTLLETSFQSPLLPPTPSSSHLPSPHASSQHPHPYTTSPSTTNPRDDHEPYTSEKYEKSCEDTARSDSSYSAYSLSTLSTFPCGDSVDVQKKQGQGPAKSKSKRYCGGMSRDRLNGDGDSGRGKDRDRDGVGLVQDRVYVGRRVGEERKESSDEGDVWRYLGERIEQ